MKLLSFMLLTWIMAAQGQTKVDKTIYDIQKTQDGLDRAKRLGTSLKGLIPKKKDKENKETLVKTDTVVKVSVNPPPTSAKTTVLTITGIDYSKLKTINENVRACAGVESANMKFDVESSTIRVSHAGTTESLMKLVFLTCKDILSEKNIVSFDEGAVRLKVI